MTITAINFGVPFASQILTNATSTGTVNWSNSAGTGLVEITPGTINLTENSITRYTFGLYTQGNVYGCDSGVSTGTFTVYPSENIVRNNLVDDDGDGSS